MASLQQLLAEEGFEGGRALKTRSKVEFRARESQDESVVLPIYIWHDRKSSDFSKQRSSKGSSLYSSSSRRRRRSLESGISNPWSNAETVAGRDNEPAIDEVAIRAMVSILSGYVGKYLRDQSFREAIKGKCYACFTRNKTESDNPIFANLEMAIESVESLAARPNGTKKELEVKSLQNSISLLTIVASLNSESSRNGSTCGIPNSHLSACAQLYLSIIYKLQKNNRISARHLLQVFCDSPFLARTCLLPELWEHLFLPHLLHLKIWHTKEHEFLSSSGYADKEKKMKGLRKLYDDQTNVGTQQFALYYKKWLKTGGEPPPVPSVPLPSRFSYATRRRKSSDSFTSHSSTNNKSLYKAVFGPIGESQALDFDNTNGSFSNPWDSAEDNGDGIKHCNYTETGDIVVHRRSRSQSYRKPEAEFQAETKKSDYFRFFTCQSQTKGCLVNGNYMDGDVSCEENIDFFAPDSLGEAISTICSSDSLSDCENAIRLLAKTWLDYDGDPKMESELSKRPVIEGIMEILFASKDDEILELAVSILAELVTRKEMNRQVILNSDPQLDIFLKLFRNSSLFLKAAALLYLVRPMAKQMISLEWIPLVLRVLEFGDHVQTLFAVQCSPQMAAYYFLEQLLSGFDEDKNLENTRQLITLGGLGLLVKRMETEDVCEKNKAVSIMYRCIRADGSCRHYLARSLNKDSFLPLLLAREEQRYQGDAFALLTELLCLHK
nr:putative E3 ubiquitin-protein ligase LIN [Ipomoea trifida]